MLVEDDEPALWALAQDFVGPDGVARTRTGVVASLQLEPYEARVVLPHERTHAGPKEGRLRLLRATHTELEPIFLLHRGPTLLEGVGEPTLEATEGGVATRLWRVTDSDAIAAPEQLLIADGHHRYETALAFHAEQGTPESGWMMVVLVRRGAGGADDLPHASARRVRRRHSRRRPAEPAAATRVPGDAAARPRCGCRLHAASTRS